MALGHRVLAVRVNSGALSPKERSLLGAAQVLRIAPSFVQGRRPGTDRFGAEAPAQTTGRETPRGPIGPAKWPFSKAKERPCQTASCGRADAFTQLQNASGASGGA